MIKILKIIGLTFFDALIDPEPFARVYSDTKYWLYTGVYR